jgi:hypothetical protein
MSETVTPVPAPQAIPVPATTAADAPKTAEEKLHERADALIKAAAIPAPTPKPVEAKVDMDPETLRKLTEASEGRRAAEKRANDERKKREEIEASSADVVPMREAMKLWKEGKRDEAISKLLGVEDPSAEIEELLKGWVAKPTKDGEKKLTPAEIKALQDEAAEGKKFREAEQARAKADTDSKNARTFSAAQRDAKTEAGEARYPLASKPENAETAATVALEKANAKLLALGSPTVTRQLAEHLFELAYTEIEANLAKEATPAVAPSEPARAAPRPAVIPKAGATPSKGKVYPRTPEGAAERLMDSARAQAEAKGITWS